MVYSPLGLRENHLWVGAVAVVLVTWVVGLVVVKILSAVWCGLFGCNTNYHVRRFMFNSSEPIVSTILGNISTECKHLDRVISVTRVHDHGISTFLVPLTPVEMEYFTVRSVEGLSNNVIGIDIIYSPGDRDATYTWLERVLDSIPGITHPFHPDH